MPRALPKPATLSPKTPCFGTNSSTWENVRDSIPLTYLINKTSVALLPPHTKAVERGRKAEICCSALRSVHMEDDRMS